MSECSGVAAASMLVSLVVVSPTVKLVTESAVIGGTQEFGTITAPTGHDIGNYSTFTTDSI